MFGCGWTHATRQRAWNREDDRSRNFDALTNNFFSVPDKRSLFGKSQLIVTCRPFSLCYRVDRGARGTGGATARRPHSDPRKPIFRSQTSQSLATTRKQNVTASDFLSNRSSDLFNIFIYSDDANDHSRGPAHRRRKATRFSGFFVCVNNV